MRKRLLAVIMTMVLLIGSSAAAFADSIASNGDNAKISKDEAKKIALQSLKNLFDSEIDEKKFETRVEFRPDYEREAMKEYVWEIYYQQNDNTSNQSIQVSINADTGKVIRFNKYTYDFRQEQTATVATITEEQAKKVCDDFTKRVNPSEIASAQYVQDPFNSYGYMGNPPIYNFRFVRLFNGIKFDSNYIMVGVNGSTGKVSSYSYRWDELKDMPSALGVVDATKALETFKENIKLTLQYIPVRNKFDYGPVPQAVKTVYAPDFTKGIMLDAKEGKMLDYSGKAATELKIKDLSEKEREELLKSAVEPAKSAVEMDKSKVEALAKEKINEIFGSGYEIESMSYMENNQMWEARGRNVWNVQFVKKGSDFRYDDRGAITIEATTGELITADKYMNDAMQDENFQPKLTWDEAYSKALKVAAKYFPGKVKDIKTEQIFRDQYYYFNDKRIQNRIYSFMFQRLINGTVYNDNGIFLDIDAKTGDVRGMRCNWDEKLQFPDTKGALSLKEAEKAYYEANTPELIYTYVEKTGSTKPTSEVKLVYRLKNTNPYNLTEFIDAFTGKPVNYMGEEVKSGELSFKDKIKGHWAEKELSIMVSQGIIDSKDLNFDGEVRKIDAVKMLVNAKGFNPYNLRNEETLKLKGVTKDDPNYKYLLLAVKYGIIDNAEVSFDSDQKLNREEVAELIGRLLQYGNLAKSKDIFVLPYKDAKEVSKDRVGYVAICKGLGIMEGNEGKFRPKDKMTMAEMAVVVYKALGSIKSDLK